MSTKTLVMKSMPNSTPSNASLMAKGKKINYKTFLVNLDSTLQLSNKPNVREVNPQAKVIKKIIATAIHEPDMMPLRNSGITVSVKSAYSKNGQVFLNVRDQDGILNGGHSQYGFGASGKHGADLKNTYVKLNVIEGEELTPADITDISTALNDSASPKISTLLNNSGLVDYMKDALKPEYAAKIEWKENSMLNTPHMPLEDLVSILNCLDIRSYGGYGKPYKSSGKGVATIINHLMSEDKSFEYLAPVMNDIIHLYELVQVSLTHVVDGGPRNKVKGIEALLEGQKRAQSVRFTKNGEEARIIEKYTLFTGRAYTYTVNKGYQNVILSAFRNNLVEDAKGIHWVVDVDTLFKSVEREIWSTVLTNSLPYKEQAKGDMIDASAATKANNSIWQSVYNVVKIAVQDMEK